MSTLYNDLDVSNLICRLETLTPDSQRKWGKMNVSQMLAHCNVAMDTVIGTHTMPRVFIGKLIGGFFKKKVLTDKTWGKSSPTDKTYIIKGDRNFEEEKEKLKSLLIQFCENGPSKCTTHPHPFFGHFTAEEWGVFQWKHLDHHFRQFDA